MRWKLTYKHFLFVGILVLLSVSRAIGKMRFLRDAPLNGTVVVENKPVFSAKGWFDESFQIQFDKYYNQNFSFRNTLVRLNCQIGYSFFSTAKANGVVIGEDGYLYEENYIRATTGIDFVGNKQVISDAEKLKKIQDTLQKLNKHIVVVLAPGKGSFYPEYIPENRRRSGKFPTNYAAYLKAFQQRNISVIDLKKHFESIKNTAPYPLYPKCGIHWSKYGEFLAADSINKYVHAATNTRGSQLVLDNVKRSVKNSDDDYDIGKGMNLLFSLNTFPMGYPVFHIKNKAAKTNPKTMFVSDSFYWGMYHQGFPTDLFGNGDFWYYNAQIYPDSFEKELLVENINIKERLEEHDVIIILTTDANLNRFSFGFVDAVYKAYFPEK